MRLFRGVVDHGVAFGFGCGQHDVDGGADGDDVKEDVAPGKVVALRGQDTGGFAGFRADGLEAFEVLVHGTGTDFAAAGGWHLGLPAPAEQGAEQVIAGAQPLGIPVGNRCAFRGPGIDPHHFPGLIFHFGAQLDENIRQGVDVFDIGQVFNGTGLIAQQGSGNDGHGCVLAAADTHLALQ